MHGRGVHDRRYYRGLARGLGLFGVGWLPGFLPGPLAAGKKERGARCADAGSIAGAPRSTPDASGSGTCGFLGPVDHAARKLCGRLDQSARSRLTRWIMDPEGPTIRNRLARRPPGSTNQEARRFPGPPDRPARRPPDPLRHRSGDRQHNTVWRLQAVGRPRPWLRTPGRYASHFPGGCPAERNTRLRSNPTPLAGP